MTSELPQGQSELTVKGINPKLNKETNIYMSEPGKQEGPLRQPVAIVSPAPDSGSSLPGIRGEEGLSNSAFYHRGFPEKLVGKYWDRQIKVRRESGEVLTPDELSTYELFKKEGLYPTFAGGAPGATADIDPARVIIDGLSPGDFSDDVFQRIVKTVKDSALAGGKFNSNYLDRLMEKAEDRYLNGGPEDEYQRLSAILQNASIHIVQVEQARDLGEATAVEIINPLLREKVDMRKITRLFEQAKDGQINKELYAQVLEEIGGIEALPADRYSSDESEEFELARHSLAAAISTRFSELMPRGREEPGVREGVAKILTAIREASDLPPEDVNSAYSIIEQVIEAGEPNRPAYAEIIKEVVEKVGPGEGKDHLLEFMMEFAMERIINVGDIAPQEQYPQFDLYETDSLNRITQIARKYDESRAKASGIPKSTNMFSYLVNLRAKRTAMHELFRGMKDRKTFLGLVTQLLRRNGLRFVEKDIAGVSGTQIMYEQILGSELSLKNQSWLTDQDLAQADETVEQLLKGDKKTIDKKFKKSGTIATRKLRDWEIKRAFYMGRSLNAASQRRAVYIAMGELPDNADILYKSVESELSVVRALAPIKFIPQRFFGQPVSRRMIKFLLEELRRDSNTDKLSDTKYGFILNGERKGLYGKSQEATSITDMAIVDPKSNSWRGRLMFLKQKGYEIMVDGKQTSLGEYLDSVAKKHKTEDKWEHEHLDGKAFNKQLREDGVLSDQRLFLGILLRYPKLDKENKAAIWKNVAKLTPSRIVAFFPEETMQIVGGEANWRNLRAKLFLAERARVMHDAGVLKARAVMGNPASGPEAEKAKAQAQKELDSLIGITDENRLEHEAAVVKARKDLGDIRAKKVLEKEGTPGYKAQAELERKAILEVDRLNGLWELKDYFGEDYANLTPEEIKIVKKLQDFGSEEGEYHKTMPNNLKDLTDEEYSNLGIAHRLSNIEFPFTAFLDDVPETGWEELTDDDYDRILVNDQSAYEEGYGHLVGLLANPVHKPEDIVKIFTEAIHKISGPPGLEHAQKLMEPFVMAYFRVATERRMAKWLGFAMKSRGMPRSEIEEFNRQANIALNEEDIMTIAKGLAQNEVIADDPHEKDREGNPGLLNRRRRTQYWRILEKAKADKKGQARMMIRMITLLFGPAFAKSLIGNFDTKDMIA